MIDKDHYLFIFFDFKNKKRPPSKRRWSGKN
jgi:hypothetical protein